MIQSFKHKSLKRFYHSNETAGINAQWLPVIRIILAELDVITHPDDITLTGLHVLKGNRAGYWAVTVTRNWRITFRIEQGNVFDVDLIDYH